MNTLLLIIWLCQLNFIIALVLLVPLSAGSIHLLFNDFHYSLDHKTKAIQKRDIPNELRESLAFLFSS